MKNILMLTASNKSDIFELLQLVWTHPAHTELNKMLTTNKSLASVSNKYHDTVSNHIRRDVLKKKKVSCMVVGHSDEDDNRFKYVNSFYMKNHFDILAPYIDVVEECGDVYRITMENAEEYIEDNILPTVCGGDHMKVTAVSDRFVITNRATGAGYNRHSLMIVTGDGIPEQKLHNLHIEIKARNKFKPYSKSEVVYTKAMGLNDIRRLHVLKCSTEEEIRFNTRDEFKEAFPEAEKDLVKLLKRSVCYFGQKHN